VVNGEATICFLMARLSSRVDRPALCMFSVTYSGEKVFMLVARASRLSTVIGLGARFVFSGQGANAPVRTDFRLVCILPPSPTTINALALHVKHG